ncbi:hypothetical protein LTR17_002556 [Elasticomyces elasticus]|nr:hypothetical protein LTR17_002556 [Elasticomyces elasticus]
MLHNHFMNVELQHGEISAPSYDEHVFTSNPPVDRNYLVNDYAIRKFDCPVSQVAVARFLDDDQEEKFRVRLLLEDGFLIFSANAVRVHVRMDNTRSSTTRTEYLSGEELKIRNSELEEDSELRTHPMVLPVPSKEAAVLLRAHKLQNAARRECVTVIITRGRIDEGMNQDTFKPLKSENGKPFTFKFWIVPKGFDFGPVAARIRKKAIASQKEREDFWSQPPPYLPPLGQPLHSTEEVAKPALVETRVENAAAAHSSLDQGSQKVREQDGGEQPSSITVQERASPANPEKIAGCSLFMTPEPETTTPTYIQERNARYSSLTVQALDTKTLHSKEVESRAPEATSTPPTLLCAQHSTQAAVPESPADKEPCETGSPWLQTEQPSDNAPASSASVVPLRHQSVQTVTTALPTSRDFVKVEPEDMQPLQTATQQHVDIDLTLSDDEDTVVIKQETGAAHTRKRQVVTFEEDDAEDDDELEAQKRVIALKKQKIEVEMEQIEFERKMREREREKKRKGVVLKLEK